MGVVDGQPVNAAITNAAFISKNTTDTMPYQLTLSGGVVIGGSASLGVTNNQTISFESTVWRNYIGAGTGASWTLSKRASSSTTDLLTVTDGAAMTLAGVFEATGTSSNHFFAGKIAVGSNSLINNGTVAVTAAGSNNCIIGQVSNNLNSVFQGFNSGSSVVFQVTGGSAVTTANNTLDDGSGNATIAANLVINGNSASYSLLANGTANNYVAKFAAASTASQSFGVQINAGTNSSDVAFLVKNQAQSSTFLDITGAGVVSTLNNTLDSSGNAIFTGKIAVGSSTPATYAVDVTGTIRVPNDDWLGFGAASSFISGNSASSYIKLWTANNTALELDGSQNAIFFGQIQPNNGSFEKTATNQTITWGTSTGPTGVTLASTTPSRWLEIKCSDGNNYYLPLFK